MDEPHRSSALTRVRLAVDPGGCAPSGGEPLGDTVPTEPSTFCCLAQASRLALMMLRSDAHTASNCKIAATSEE
ncbi:hypothetical protein WMF04_32765 [Sorangium sp. So ce260]|uniref:hypothetical protein n=1 Tax=Sorangium sp. So ce260 TaxID=3133291 RepID=UPI003F5FD8F6